MATIKPISGQSIHQIQSGQVIVDLCSVVKELVENSLDAGATSIEVRFKSQGLESIEVQDNGGGIAPEDYETIALKHYTSKLSTYDDLSSLATFGFRGEALSSLCALSRFHIVTATNKNAPKGKRLDFETSGKLSDTSVAACPTGTSVAVENLFYNLSVRRRELEKNIKREYGKVLSVLNAYACISTGVRFSVSNQMTKGKKTLVFSTKANVNAKENIANVFGAKALLGLIPLNLELELLPSVHQTPLSLKSADTDHSRQVQILGHVSRPVFGEGRQAPDRQMFFVNSRPCNLPQIAKAFNEVYKSYNITQSPFVFADLKLNTNAYDVNVSPDKRTIMLHDQPALLESLKKSLNELFQNQEQTVPQSQLFSKQLPSFRPVTINNHRALAADEEELPGEDQAEPQGIIPYTHLSLTENDRSQPESSSEPAEPGDLLQKFVSRRHRDRRPNELPEIHYQIENHSDSVPDVDVGDYSPRESQSNQTEEPVTAELPLAVRDFNDRIASQQMKSNLRPDSRLRSVSKSPIEEQSINNAPPVSNNHEGGIDVPLVKRRKLDPPTQVADANARLSPLQFSNKLSAFASPGSRIENISGLSNIQAKPSTNKISQERTEAQQEDSAEFVSINSDPEDGESDIEEEIVSERNSSDSERNSKADSDDEYIDEDERKKRDEARIQEMLRRAEEAAAKPSRKQKGRAENILNGASGIESTVSLMTEVNTSIQEISEKMKTISRAQENPAEPLLELAKENELVPQKASAEERLSLTIAKSDFKKMRIVGQFNLGFILTTRKSTSVRQKDRLSEDLFIIDQHASDEIFNFTRLSLTTNLTPQPLVRPHSLELTAAEEETILENADTLEKNGFNLSVDQSGDLPVGQRCHVLTLPTSRETVFDLRDLEELIALLGESGQALGSANTVRPSRVRKMLAMRACRSSVMVGKALTRTGMERLVQHMGEIDRPWNCPHGRPTMRHLATLSDWKSWDEGDGLVDDDEQIHEKTNWIDYESRTREAKQAATPDEMQASSNDGSALTQEVEDNDSHDESA